MISRLSGLLVSASTLLRLVNRQDLVVPEKTSGVIGIDDWAVRKGKSYGTIIVDLCHNQVKDLLPGRESETTAQWLKKHPEITVVSRDRGGPYAKGVRAGAPQAIQVADRFHLLVNLGGGYFPHQLMSIKTSAKINTSKLFVVSGVGPISGLSPDLFTF